MVLSQQSRRAFGVAVSLFCLCSGLAKAQFFEEPAVWKGTDSLGREVVLYVSTEGRFFSPYPLLTSAGGDGHGVWAGDPADSTIRFRSLSSEDAAFSVDLISRRYALAKGPEGAVILTAGATGHQLSLKPSAASPAFLPEELIEYSVQVPENAFYDTAKPAAHGLNLETWLPHGVVFTDSLGSEIALEGADRERFRVQRDEAAGHTLVYLAEPLPAKADRSGYELDIIRRDGLAKRPIVAASVERFSIQLFPGDSVVNGLPPIFALPPIFLGPEPDAPVKIRLFGANNFTLSVQASADLANWSTVEEIDGQGEFVDWIDSRENRPAALYYRVRLTPRELASPGVFDYSGGKPIEPGSQLAQNLAKTVLARLNIDGRNVTGATVDSVVRLLPPIFGPQYLVELRGKNEQQQPVSVYAELGEAGVQKMPFVTKINVDDRWEMIRRTKSVELDDDLSLAPGAVNADRSAASAGIALADLNERTGKNWSLVEVVSSRETGSASDHLVLSLVTPEGEAATVFAEVGTNPETNQTELLTAFTQSELGITVVPLEFREAPEAGDADFASATPGRVELSPVETGSPLAKRLAQFVLGQEPAAEQGLKLERIVAVTGAKSRNVTTHFIELRATTENGAKALVQANVSESNEGQFGLLSLQLTVGD